MNWIIEYIDSTVAFIKKNIQIAQTHVLKNVSGLSCEIIPEGWEQLELKQANNLNLIIKISHNEGNWKEVIQKMFDLQAAFKNCEYKDNDSKIKFKSDLGDVTREDNESEFILVLSLTLKGVRLDA